MKLSRKLILTTALAAFLGLGAAVGAQQARQAKEVKAAYTSRTVYCAIDTSVLGSYTLKLNCNVGDNNTWVQSDMIDLNDTTTYPGKKVFKGIFEERYNGVDVMQFQLYDGGTWKDQDQVISSYAGYSTYSGKLHVYKGSGWSNYTEPTPVSNHTITRYAVLDGGSPIKIDDFEIAEGTSYDVPGKIYRSGYSFDGWYTTAACSTPYAVTTVNADLDIYAKYTTAPGASGNITVDLRDTGWAEAAANYAICFMDKTTYPSVVMEWSTYVTGTAANECLVTIPYNIGFEPEELLVYRYKPTYSQADWEAEQFATGENKWGQTIDVAFNEHIVIGTVGEGESKNSAYTGYARVLGAVAPAAWGQIELLDSIKSNDSHHVEYYSDSVTLAAGCEFKIVIGNNEYYAGFSTHSSIASDFSGDGDSNITAIKGGTYSFYFDSVAKSVYITDPVIADADEWAQSFNKAAGCSATKSAWGTLAGTYATLVTKYGDAFSNIFKNEAHVDHSVTEGLSYVAQAVQRYDYVLELYGVNDANTDASGYQDFIGRVAAGKVTPKHNARANIFGNITDNNSALLIAGIAALLAASAVAGYFLLRKKKQK